MIDRLSLRKFLFSTKEKLVGAFLQKIVEISEFEIYFRFRIPGENLHYLVYLEPQNASLIPLTQKPAQAQPPKSFTMLCRKHIQGLRVIRVEVLGCGEWILHFSNDFRLAQSFLSNRPNQLLIAPSGKVSHLRFRDQDYRPGKPFPDPDLQPAYPWDFAWPQDLVYESKASLQNDLAERFGKALSESLIHLLEQKFPQLFSQQPLAPATIWQELLTLVATAEPLALDHYKGRLTAFAPTPHFTDWHQAWSQFRQEQPVLPGIEREKLQFLQTLKKRIKKAKKKITNRQNDLAKARQYESIKTRADLLLSYQHSLPKRAPEVTLYDYEGKECTITLDPKRTLSQNIERFYQRYKKLKRAIPIITKQIALAEQEHESLLELEVLLQEVDDRPTLAELRGAIKPRKSRKKKRPSQESKILRLEREGHLIWIGKTPQQNERLVTRVGRSNDLWFHLRGGPGSHVLLRGPGGGEPQEKYLYEAASYAAYYSKRRLDTRVEVLYTHLKYVRSIPQGPIGKVTYYNDKTLTVQPQELKQD